MTATTTRAAWPTDRSEGAPLVFEVQQNSDVTFRLFDWNHVDAKTQQPRALKVRQALECIDLARGPVSAVVPVPGATSPGRESLFRCHQFGVSRVHARVPFTAGARGVPRIIVVVEGTGRVEHEGARYGVGRGDVVLLPAILGVCTFRPDGAVIVLEVALPSSASDARSACSVL